MKILMVHPSSELYGSDRMFLLSIKACMTQFAESHIEVLLPHPGPLVSEIHKISQDIKVQFHRMGILRKSDFKILNFKALFEIVLYSN